MTNNRNEKYRYFPHPEMRKGQPEIMDDVYLCARSTHYNGIIITADPGLGKEACMVAQAILVLKENLYDRIIFAIPTDAGKENILKELNAIQHGYSVMKVNSKEILCEWLKDKDDPKILAVEGTGCGYMVCQDHSNECRYRENGCRYKEQSRKIRNTTILICDYNYIISPFIRKFSGFGDILQNNRTLLFINECNQMPRRAETILSNKISTTSLDRAIKELEKYGYKKETAMVERMKLGMTELIQKHRTELDRQFRAGYLDYGIQWVTMNAMKGVCKSGSILERAGKEISNIKFEKEEGKLSYAHVVGKFLNGFESKQPYNKQTVFFVGQKKDGTGFMGWKPIEVGGYIRQALELGKKYVLYSGTVNAPSFRKVMGIIEHKVLMPKKYESPFIMNRKDIILNNTVFRAERLEDPEFIKKARKDITKLLSVLPKPTAIVCTNRVYKALDIENLHGLSGRILNEPESQDEMSEWRNKAEGYEYIRYTEFGRLAQSIDLSFLKGVLFIGFPYPVYDATMKRKLEVMAKSYKGKSGNAKFRARFIGYISPAWENVVQSAMRGLRTENDSLVVVYFDKAYQMHKKLLYSKTLVICDTLNKAMDEIKSHLNIIKTNEGDM